MTGNRKSFFHVFFNAHILIMLFLGFSSGLPLALVGSTMQAWLTAEGVNLVTIGFFSLAGLPYLYKFFWSPVLDRYNLFQLGRRRGWMLITQAGLFIALFLIAWQKPSVGNVCMLGILALIAAFFSATQDTAIDAYRTDLLLKAERGLGSAVFIAGWRVGYLLSGGVALIIAQYWGWHVTYLLMAICMLVGFIAALFAPEPKLESAAPKTLNEAFIKPFKEFFNRRYAISILLFVVLYKLGDAFALSFMTTFLMRMGFELAFIGSVFKIFGVIATVIGGLVAGSMMTRLGLYKALFWFGILQASASIVLIMLAMIGKNNAFMIVSVTYDSFVTGMAATAFVAYLMSLCDHRFTAAQYALLSAFSAVGRVILGPLAGMVAECYGWEIFFFISLILAMPGLYLLFWLHKKLDFDLKIESQ